MRWFTRVHFRLWLAAAIAAPLLTIRVGAAPQTAQREARRRFLVVARSLEDLAVLRADAEANGGAVVTDLSQIGALAVSGTNALSNPCGPAVPDSEAYGAGLINARIAVRPF
jgi:hypothetical protein